LLKIPWAASVRVPEGFDGFYKCCKSFCWRVSFHAPVVALRIAYLNVQGAVVGQGWGQGVRKDIVLFGQEQKCF
jgi:hypothetical protein